MSLDAILGFLSYLPPFLLALSVVVFVHELGHYSVARWNGVRVEIFSIGFGPEIFGWNDAHGTRWRISLIPLGGYVKMLGEQSEFGNEERIENGASRTQHSPEESLIHKSVGQKIAILFAGPFYNYLFAFLAMFVLFASAGQQYLSSEIQDVVGGGAAARAGLRAGDHITAVDNHAIESFSDLQKALSVWPRDKKQVTLTFERDGQVMNATVEPDLKETKDRFGRIHHSVTLGVTKSSQHSIRQHSLTGALATSFHECLALSWGMLEGLGQMILGLRSSDELRGVLSIAKISGDVAQRGMSSFAMWLALLSINLGLLNLLPIPPLDGGHILFYTIQSALGRPVAERLQDVVFKLGFSFILLILVLSFWNDLKHIGLVRWVGSLIGF